MSGLSGSCRRGRRESEDSYAGRSATIPNSELVVSKCRECLPTRMR